MKNIRFWIEFSLIKTMIFNIRYFGVREGIHLRVILSRNVKFINMGGQVKVEKSKEKNRNYFGFRVSGIADFYNERFIWDNSGTVCFEEGVFLGSGVRISNSGFLFIGSGCFVTANTAIICTKRVSIGRGCKVSWDCLIMDSDFHEIVDFETNKTINEPRPVCISDNVWIGCNSIILKGSCVPTMSVIAAGSVTRKELYDSNCIYKDNKVIRRGIIWKD